MSTLPLVTTIFQHLVTIPELCLVIGANDAVCEMFVDPQRMDFRVDERFITMENGPWHIHLDATSIRKITFVVTPDTAHGDAHRLSYSVRFFNTAGVAMLRAFFLSMYDADGHLQADRVQQYEALRACGGGHEVLVLSAS